MRRRTPLFIVTSARPRVGKTLVARALTEYFSAQQRPVAAFDVNPGEFKLIDHLPDVTTAASLDDTRSEMALFDELLANNALPKVIDLGHMAAGRFFAVMHQIEFIAEAERQALAPTVLFVADPDERAKRSYAMLSEGFAELPLVPVFNDHIPQLTRYHANFPPTRRGGDPIRIPALSAVVRSVVDRPNFSFVAYANKTGDKTSELFDWMRRMFVAFHELEVRLLLGEIAPQLKHSA